MAINYAIFLLALPYIPWFISNALAIAVSTFWNYLNDVGAWAHFWGFKLEAQEK